VASLPPLETDFGFGNIVEVAAVCDRSQDGVAPSRATAAELSNAEAGLMAYFTPLAVAELGVSRPAAAGARRRHRSLSPPLLRSLPPASLPQPPPLSPLPEQPLSPRRLALLGVSPTALKARSKTAAVGGLAQDRSAARARRLSRA
jgi:hypothetical protein